MSFSYYFSATSTKASTLSEIIVNHIQTLMDNGLIVRAVICDQGPNNRSVFTKLKLTKEIPRFINNNIKVSPLFDGAHLFTNLKNNLLYSDIYLKNNTISFSDIKQTYLIDKRSTISGVLLKIRDRHINPGTYRKFALYFLMYRLYDCYTAIINRII